jgi:acetyl/propionyl-CoA carboxylase alpha subunit
MVRRSRADRDYRANGPGFLSENDEFAEKVEKAGMVWVGPSSGVITQFGLKHTARELAVKSGVSD